MQSGAAVGAHGKLAASSSRLSRPQVDALRGGNSGLVFGLLQDGTLMNWPGALLGQRSDQ